MRILTLIFLLAASVAHAQFQFPLPRIYVVTGVAANDTLNIRDRPSASSDDIGDLLPGQSTEVLMLSDDGNWGLVSLGERTGWVSTLFLQEMPKTIGLSPNLPYGMPAELACSGTEPFWSLHVFTGENVQFSDYSADAASPVIYPMLGVASPVNRGPDTYAFSSPALTGILRREMCDDGMSGALFGWRLELLKTNGGALRMLSGCCTALQP